MGYNVFMHLATADKSVRPKVLGAKPKQAGKKGGGWGEGIFARLLLFPFRLSKRKAEGGFGGNSAFLLPNQNEASPATLQFIARHHRKILFSLREKEIGRAQNEKSKEYFSVVWGVVARGGGRASLVGVSFVEGSREVYNYSTIFPGKPFWQSFAETSSSKGFLAKYLPGNFRLL